MKPLIQIKEGSIRLAQKASMISNGSSRPTCPSCRRMADLARITPRFGGLPELQTFICRPCGEVFTEAVVSPVVRPDAGIAARRHENVVEG